MHGFLALHSLRLALWSPVQQVNALLGRPLIMVGGYVWLELSAAQFLAGFEAWSLLLFTEKLLLLCSAFGHLGGLHAFLFLDAVQYSAWLWKSQSSECCWEQQVHSERAGGRERVVR